jgi:hypothetical protein
MVADFLLSVTLLGTVTLLDRITEETIECNIVPTKQLSEMAQHMRHGQDKISGILTGVSGEYFVAGELSRRGYIASITLRNTRGIDVLVSNGSTTRSVGLQVKTNHGERKAWLLNNKAEDYFSENLFYVFVNLKNNTSRPDYYIVPSKVVAKHVKKGHAKWLRTPGKRVKQHTDNPMRMFQDETNEYLEKWELLGL